MFKWNPVYRVTIYTKDETITIELPLTCKMSITRSILTQNTSADIEIYNLAYQTRKSIDQPPFQALTENKKYVIVEAGYGQTNSMYIIFKGYILEAYSSKQGGSTDVITHIQAQALDLLTSYSSHQFEAGTSFRDIFKTLSADMPNCSIGNVGALEGEVKTATTFEGKTLEQLNKVTGGSTFIDNGQINCILQNEVIDVPVPLITDDNALLGTPKRSASNLTIKTLFEPSLIVGQLLEIQSVIERDFNGQYKVLGFTHDLYFSSSTEGQRTTSVELWYTKNLQNSPIYVSGDKVLNNVNKVKNEVISPVDNSIVDTNWIKPVDGVITSNYGKREQPKKGASINHSGVDLRAPIGTPVKAIADGIISAARAGMRGYGIGVFIEHGVVDGKRIKSEYGHLSRYIVSLGQKVKKGQIIAYSGNSGTSTGPHLHLTIRENGEAVNPQKYIKTL